MKRIGCKDGGGDIGVALLTALIDFYAASEHVEGAERLFERICDAKDDRRSA